MSRTIRLEVTTPNKYDADQHAHDLADQLAPHLASIDAHIVDVINQFGQPAVIRIEFNGDVFPPDFPGVDMTGVEQHADD